MVNRNDKYEKIDNIIIELDKVISSNKKSIKSINDYYLVNGQINSNEYPKYNQKMEEEKNSTKEEIIKILGILDKECKRIRYKQAALEELSVENINKKNYIPRNIVFGKRRIKTDYISKNIEVPKVLDFPFNKNMYVVGYEQNELIHQIALRILFALPIGKVNFYIYDSKGLGSSFDKFNTLLKEETIFPNKKILTDKKELKETLENVLAYISDLRQNKFNSETKNWEEYNRMLYSKGKYKEMLPYKVFLFNDVPEGMGEEEFENFRKLLINSKDCGFLIIYSFNEIILEAEDMRSNIKALELKKCIANSYPLETIFNNKTDILDLKNIEIKNLSERTPDRYLFEEKINIYKSQLEILNKNENQFEDFLDFENIFNKSSKEGLDIPIGYTVDNNLLNTEIGDNVVHYLIGGSTGSGKSTFLHSIILSMCSRYSPEELNIFLLDFKEAVEFNIYAQDNILPHATLIATDADINFGLSVLQYICNVIKERATLFKRYECKDIRGYREKSGEKLPRMILIMDEFQILLQSELNSKVIEKMLIIAKQGRSYGIHMILSTQTLKGVSFESIPQQLRGRIVLKSSIEDSMSLLGGNNEAAAKITKPYAILNTENGYESANIKFKVPYHKDKIKEYVRSIKNFSDSQGYKVNNKIFDGNKNPIRPEIDDFMNSNKLSLNLGIISDYYSERFVLDLNKERNSNLLLLVNDNFIKKNIIQNIIYSLDKCEGYKYIYIGINESEYNFSSDKLIAIYSEYSVNIIQELNDYMNQEKIILLLDDVSFNLTQTFGLSQSEKDFSKIIIEMYKNDSHIISFYKGYSVAKKLTDVNMYKHVISYKNNSDEMREMCGIANLRINNLLYINNKELQFTFKTYVDGEEDD